MKPVTLAASILAASVLATLVVAPIANAATPSASSSSPDRRTTGETSADAKLSAAALGRLNTLESVIAAAGACKLPSQGLSQLISGLISSPVVSQVGVGAASSKVCADITAVASPNLSGSAMTSMWAWGNPVSAADDARGQGDTAMTASTLSAYAASRHLRNVRLSVPWASDQGTAFRTWLSGTVTAVHANGETISALGGDTAWVSNPALVSQWMTAARNAAPFDGVQLDVEPWTSDSTWTTNPVAIARYIAMIKQAQTTAHALGMTLTVDTPWWLSTTPYGSGSVLTALLPYVDGVSIVAFSDHAGSTDGIIAQAWPAAVEAAAGLTPFSIGVQTSSDDVSGGAQYTFADKGSASLEAETAKVRAAYTPTVGYTGVTVEEYLSWIALKA